MTEASTRGTIRILVSSLSSEEKKSSDQENLGRVKVTCRKSLLHAKHEAKRSRHDSSSSISPVAEPEGIEIPNVLPTLEIPNSNRKRLLPERGRAFTCPGPLRARTTSERAEEKDQVMPLPIIPRRGWNSCNALPINGVHAKMVRSVPHYKSKKTEDQTKLSWKRVQKDIKTVKKSHIMINPQLQNNPVIKVAHRGP